MRFLVNILQSIRKRDYRWVTLASDQLRLTELFLRDNTPLGDNDVLLFILIHIARLIGTNRSDLEILAISFQIQHMQDASQTANRIWHFVESDCSTY